MSRPSISTPCPAPYSLSGLPVPANRRQSTVSVDSAQDDTTEIDYTRALNLDLKHAKPRRRSTFQQRRVQREAAITIFEDVLEEQELVVEPRRPVGGSTLLARPAQRPMLRAGQQNARYEQAEVATYQKRRTSIMAQQPAQGKRMEALEGSNNVEDTEQPNSRAGLKKEPRRRTIFVPSDDTTMLTIHPGAHTTDRLNDTFQLPNDRNAGTFLPEKTQTLSMAGIAKAPKRPRLSIVGDAKRIPLQTSMERNLYNLPEVDVPGQNGGKENLPPGYETIPKHQNQKVDFAVPEKPKLARSGVFQATAASKARQSIVPRQAVPLPDASSNMADPHAAPLRRQSLRPDTESYRLQPKQPRVSFYMSNEQQKRPAPDVDEIATEGVRQSANQQPKPLARKLARLSQYPVLAEDLAQPELYEDSWLSHQEIALTEVINQIFRDAEPVLHAWESETPIRERLLTVYHQEQVTRLHRRLQASLLYGALSRPAGGPSPPNPAHDIGLRKRFLNLWLESYNHRVLRAAAEVVFGRELPKRLSATNDDRHSTLDPHRGRRSLVAFLETFLVEVEDVEEPEVDRGDDAFPRWRKMVLRSLMLIWLLDRVPTSETISGCLFKSTSPRKTSVAMLQAFATLLVPSIGDITRTLRHLDYDVEQVQDPLDEVHYGIENIAVDLRDGVLLTRLVELLLFPRKRLTTVETNADATVTIRMPDLTILESALTDNDGSRCPRVLSQHLKIPSLGRAQKVYNVEIAISALREHGRLADNAGDVSADDVVNGHRERTLSLLWSLVSTHGLEQFVDFNGLATEVRRLCSDTVELPSDLDSLSQLQQESLLKKWASAHCAGQGIRVGNLTTSFADGKAYAAILESFANHISTGNERSKDNTGTITDLRLRLQSFGCSEAFTKQIIGNAGAIPSRKTTIANLAFLASRLLPLARRHTAATAIQRAYRRRRGKAQVSQRIALMRLAYDCATVVRTQQRVAAAATVLQRAWRSLIDKRVDTLNKDVEAIQCIAHGWLVRRRLQTQKRQSMRVMGGW